MPIMRFSVTAVTVDALQNRKFNIVGGRGALISLWASCATATDTWGLSSGNGEIAVQGQLANVEIAANRCLIEQDQLVFQEPVPPGQLFLPVPAVTTRINFLLNIAYL